MSTRSAIVRLEAQVGGYVAGLGRAATETENLARRAAQARNNIADQDQAMNTAGQAMTIFGASTVAALGASAKAAMDWESAWAGVTKTVDGTPEQMAQLESELRGLAKTLPATHQEIAAVAEAAGQLGVAREDVAAFTKTMIDLSETTNLTADDAATSIAQFMNVMGTAGEDVDNLGSALVALGNDGASTEAEIMAMAQRLSGMGKLVGASESDVLALANAMASVGIEAQLGGGVMSRVMQGIYADVKEGGEGLEGFAKVAGMSAKDYAAAFESDPVRATDAFIKGLSGIADSGGNVIGTLDDLGIKGTQDVGVLLRLAGAGDLLSESLDLGAQAWENNTALMAEAEKRYETTEAEVQIAWNNIKDAAIDAGAVLLPAIQTVAETVSGLASAFGDLPAPIQGTITVLAGVVGAAALAGGGLLMIIPRAAETVKAFRDLNRAGSSIPGTFGKIAKGAAAAGAIAAVGVTIAKIAESGYMDDIDQGMGRVAAALAGVGKDGPGAATALDEVFKDRNGGDLISTVDDLDSALNRTFNKSWDQSFNDWGSGLMNTITGVKGSTEILADSWSRLDQGLSDLVNSGDTELAEENFLKISEAAKAQGIGVEELATLFPQYADALKAAAAEQENAERTGANATETIESVGNAAEQAAKQADDLVDSLLAMNNVNLSASDAQLKFDQAVADSAENLENAGAGVDYLNEKTGAFNQTAADNLDMLNGIASAGNQTAQAVYEQTGSYDAFRESLKSSRDALFEVAKAYYPTEEAAWAYVDSVLAIPEEMKTTVNITDNNSIEGIKENLGLLHDAIQATPDKTVTIEEPMSPEIKRGLENLGYVVENLPDGTIQVTESGTDATGKKIDETARKERMATIDTQAITDAAEEAINHAARDRTSTIWTTQHIQKFEEAGVEVGYYQRAPSAPRKAAGGDLDMAPGPKGVDSQLFYGAKGEHVFTAKEVDMMGGQAAVYRFRAKVRSGEIPSYASGGAIGQQLYAPAAAGGGALAIDYDRLADVVGAKYYITVPDRATARDFFDAAQHEAWRNSRGGGSR